MGILGVAFIKPGDIHASHITLAMHFQNTISCPGEELLDISHLLQIRLIASELNIDHGIGVYEVNKFCFADPFVGYSFSLLEFDRFFVTIGDTEEVFVDRIMRYESSDV